MKKFTFILLLGLLASVNAWSYRITDNYTIETKFRINQTAAGIAFSGYQGFGGDICMWQFSIGGGEKSVVRPHDWRVGGILLEEVSTVDKGITLNNTDWFVTKIVISNNGNHANTYLRKADQPESEFKLIDSRDSRMENEFRFGLVGIREDGESASFDYFKVTDAEGKELYFDDFETSSVEWRGEYSWSDGYISVTSTGGDKRSFPNNMFYKAVDMHYSLDADVFIEKGYISFVFGLDGSSYMWQLSPNYYNDGSANIYYHLDNGNESWKAHAAGPRFLDFFADDFINQWRHITINVDGNVVTTWIDGILEDNFTQCDMTDLERLNDGAIGLRADGNNNSEHKGKIDNVKLTHFDADGNVVSVDFFDDFTGNVSRYFDVDSSPLVSVENGELVYNTTLADDHFFRLIQRSAPATPFVISDTREETTVPAPLTTDVKIERTFTPGAWNTFCVPFSMDAAQVESAFGEDAKVATFDSMDGTNNDVMKFITTTAIEAGQPCLIWLPATFSATSITVNAASVNAPEPLSVGNANYKFVGTYAKHALATDGTNLFLKPDGDLAKPAAATNVMNGLRAYFVVPAGSQTRISIDDDVPTSIDNLMHATDSSMPVYDLQGRTVAAPAKGLYVKEGKKFIVK